MPQDVKAPANQVNSVTDLGDEAPVNAIRTEFVDERLHLVRFIALFNNFDPVVMTLLPPISQQQVWLDLLSSGNTGQRLGDGRNGGSKVCGAMELARSGHRDAGDGVV